MVIHLLSGFLGSGKTTTIRRACTALLEKGKQPAVITNDQGVNIVDSRLFAYMGVPQRQVGNGCFCCNYEELDGRLKELLNHYEPELIFAESVGTCTDIIATVMKPLMSFRSLKATISTVVDAKLFHLLVIEKKPVFDQDVQYIFFKQLEEAGIIVINKTDLLRSNELNEVRDYIGKNYPQRQTVFQDLRQNIPYEWLEALEKEAEKNEQHSSLDINYDRYAAGEAMMAYYDGELEIVTEDHNAEIIAFELWNDLVSAIEEKGLPAGHLKCWLNNRIKISKTATTSEEIEGDLFGFTDVDRASILINARVQTAPDQLAVLVDYVIEKRSVLSNCTVHRNNESVFSPGYPKPLHRIGNTA